VNPDPDETPYAIINTETGERVIESDAENESSFVYVFFFPEGVLVNTFGDPDLFHYYRASDQQLFELPMENTSYFDVLNDNSLFYTARDEGIPPQIGLYELEAGEKQVIVEGLLPLPTRPAFR
jgi:hypothetical protein